MQDTRQTWMDKMRGFLFMLTALAIALLVGAQGLREGKSWFACIFMGAVAGVLFSYAGVLLLMIVVMAARRVLRYFHRG
jgi:hypothetical protein